MVMYIGIFLFDIVDSFWFILDEVFGSYDDFNFIIFNINYFIINR